MFKKSFEGIYKTHIPDLNLQKCPGSLFAKLYWYTNLALPSKISGTTLKQILKNADNEIWDNP